MKKTAFLLVVGALFLHPTPLPAQIANGSFTDGLTDWITVGGSSSGPEVTTANPMPATLGTSALVQSTDEDFTLSQSASAATLNAALGVTLPATYDGDILDSTYGQSFPAVNGQAIYQTFNLTAQATLSFDFSYQTNDYYPYDSVGYVLDGVYTPLVTTPIYTGSVNPTPTAYLSILPLTLDAGSHTLGFVSYNPGGHGYSTSLYVTDITVPEPTEWALMLFGGVGLILARKLRAKFSV